MEATSSITTSQMSQHTPTLSAASCFSSLLWLLLFIAAVDALDVALLRRYQVILAVIRKLVPVA